MTHDSSDSSETPPSDPHAPYDMPAMPPPDSTWPKVIGGLSLAYAIAGLVCGGSGQLWAIFGMEWQLKLMGVSDVDLSMSPMVRGMQLLGFVALLIFGVYLLLGAIGMLRRQRAGFTRLRRWAVARLVWCVLAFVIAFITLPESVDQSVRMQEAMYEGFRENDPNATFPEVDRDQQMKISVFFVVVVTGLTAIYPVFLGIYLSSAKRRQEVETWA